MNQHVTLSKKPHPQSHVAVRKDTWGQKDHHHHRRSNCESLKNSTELVSRLHRTDRFKNGHGLLAKPDRIEDVVVEDGLEKIVFVIGFKRRLACHHLVHQHPQSPPVH